MFRQVIVVSKMLW